MIRLTQEEETSHANGLIEAAYSSEDVAGVADEDGTARREAIPLPLRRAGARPVAARPKI
jgi:hypothetical protein